MMDKERLSEEEFERIYLHPMITSFDLTVEVSTDEFKTFYTNVMEELRNNLRNQDSLPTNTNIDNRFGIVPQKHAGSSYSVFCSLFGITIRQRHFNPNKILSFGGYKLSKSLAKYDSEVLERFNADTRYSIKFQDINPMNLVFSKNYANSLYRGTNEFNVNTLAYTNLRKLFMHLGLDADKYIPITGDIDCGINNIRIDTNFQYKSRCDFYVCLNRLVAEKMGYVHPDSTKINDERHTWITTFSGNKYYTRPVYDFTSTIFVRMSIPSVMTERYKFNSIKMRFDNTIANDMISGYRKSDPELYSDSIIKHQLIQISIIVSNIRLLCPYCNLNKVKSIGDLFRSMISGQIDTYGILYDKCIPMFGAPDSTIINESDECTYIDILSAESDIIPINYKMLPAHNHIRDYYFSKNAEIVPILSKLPKNKHPSHSGPNFSYLFKRA